MKSSDKLKKREGIAMNDGEAFLRGVAERMNKIDQDYDTIIKVSDVNAHNIQKHDVVTELFKLTREKRKEVLDTIGDIWDALVEESVTRVNSSDLVVSKSSKLVNPTLDNNMPGKVAPRELIIQSVFIHEQPSSYVGATRGSKRNQVNQRRIFVCYVQKIYVMVPNSLDLARLMMDSKLWVKKKKKKGKSKSTNGDQLGDHPVKQTLRYEPKATTSSPKKGTTDLGDASKSSTMLKTTVTSIMNDNILVSNPYSALDEESEEEVENVYDE
nr:hypothetical protein [Tanacetum cinerariifolium]